MRTLLRNILGHDASTTEPIETKYSRFEPKPGASRTHVVPNSGGDAAMFRLKAKRNARLAQRLIREDPELAPQPGSAEATAEQLSNDGTDQIPLSVLVNALPGKAKITEPVTAPKMSLT